MTDEMKRIGAAEFRAEGYLQEVNRRFLHPLGLALEVVRQDDGSVTFGGVWDYRDDPEGMAFGEHQALAEKAERIDVLWEARRGAREAGLGYMVQPVEGAQ